MKKKQQQLLKKVVSVCHGYCKIFKLSLKLKKIGDTQMHNFNFVGFEPSTPIIFDLFIFTTLKINN